MKNINLKDPRILTPILLVVANLLVKGFYLTSQHIAGDEPFSIYHAQMDLASIYKLLSTGNNPPLYEMLLHFWIDLFGISPLSVRFPSLLFSTLTVFFIYRIGLKQFSARVGLYAAVFFIFSNYHILFAHEARAYALVGMLSSISMFYFLELFREAGPSKKSAFFFVLLSNIALIYTHYFGFFILIIQVALVLTDKVSREKYWKHLVLGIGLIALFYLPHIEVVLKRFIDSSSNGTWLAPPNERSLYNMIISFSNTALNAEVAILVFLLSAIVFLFRKKKVKWAEKTLLVWVVFCFFFMFFVSFKVPMFLDRYLMFLSVGFCILLALASDALIQKRPYKYILPLLLCMMYIYSSKPNISNNRNTKDTVEKIKSMMTEETVVYFCPPWFDHNFLYYYDSSLFRDVDSDKQKKKMHSLLRKENIHPIYNKNGLHSDLIKSSKKVIYLDAGANFGVPNNQIMQQLESECTLVEKHKYHQIFNIHVFEPNR